HQCCKTISYTLCILCASCQRDRCSGKKSFRKVYKVYKYSIPSSSFPMHHIILAVE
ncbi:hypothetical protein BDZ97DRAFT_1838236, partial [Flammula alnicola]